MCLRSDVLHSAFAMCSPISFLSEARSNHRHRILNGWCVLCFDVTSSSALSSQHHINDHAALRPITLCVSCCLSRTRAFFQTVHWLHWRSGISHVVINSARVMQALALCLIGGHYDNLRTLPYDLHLRSDILVYIRQCGSYRWAGISYCGTLWVPVSCSKKKMSDMLWESMVRRYLPMTIKGTNSLFSFMMRYGGSCRLGADWGVCCVHIEEILSAQCYG